MASLLASITAPHTEFIVAALRNSQELEDATVAISTLASSLAREEIDEISSCQLPGCSDLIQILLELQGHPVHNVAVQVQDIPIAERHPDLAAPLYQQLVEVILNRVSYPSNFVSWEDELELESSDFDEMRRLSTDLLVGAYFLLRSAYCIETLANILMAIDSQEWVVVESALWCMCAVSREACARIKSVNNAVSSGRDSPVAADGDSTRLGLTQVLPSICANLAAGISSRHVLVSKGIANFLGVYSTVWASSSPPQTIIEILAFLTASMQVATISSGNSIRLVMISSAVKLAKITTSPGADISNVLTKCMEASLSTNNRQAMASVAEGCARLTVQIRDTSKSRSTLSAVTAPTIARARSALDVIIASSSVQGSGQATGQVDEATEVLASYLGVLKELVRFCDAPKTKAGESHVLTDVLTAVWPVLNDISSNSSCRANEAVLSGLLDIHSQLLSVVPSLIGPYFKDLITFVVKAYEESYNPTALEFVAAAVESFDIEPAIGMAAGLDNNGREETFKQLLSHLCKCTFNYVTQTKPPSDCSLVIKALFEMAHRYLMFSPGALVQCSDFASLFQLAAACLTECKIEVQSTRATLIFLSQLFGWRYLRLSDDKVAILTQFSSTIDNLLAQNGEAIIKSCINGLTGGASQMLWPAYSECVFSIMFHINSSEQTTEEPNPLLCNWLQSAMADSSIVKSQNVTQDLISSFIKILISLSKVRTNLYTKWQWRTSPKSRRGRLQQRCCFLIRPPHEVKLDKVKRRLTNFNLHLS